MGFYEGVNLSLAYCDDCGHEELEMDVCPACGSKLKPGAAFCTQCGKPVR